MRTSQHGKTQNWFGGSSNASTQLLDGMHYRGLLRIARRDSGMRLYAAREAHAAAPDPRRGDGRAWSTWSWPSTHPCLPRRSASWSATCAPPRRNGATPAAPRWHVRKAQAAERLVDGVDVVLARGEDPASRRHAAARERVRLLAPFDPVVWDRRRFEHFWGWAYRFEAYTPAPKRGSATTRCRCCGATR